MEEVLITGGAGFIGFHVAKKLLELNYGVVCYDDMNDYYDVELKKKRVDILKENNNFSFYKADICDRDSLESLISNHNIVHVIHLAAQAGVRYSLVCPEKYIETNIRGTFEILELCRKHHIYNLMFASSSSVYGDAQEEKLNLGLNTDKPISLYAATKKCDELLAYTYCNNYKINAVGMRFFTVYGPYGRPDMAYYKFTDKIEKGEIIEIYNYGKQYRDFTYIDDLITGIIGIFYYQRKFNNGKGDYKIYNIGSSSPVELMTFIQILEEVIGKKARKIMCDKRIGDVEKTYADISALQEICNYKPKTNIRDGLQAFYNWYKEYKK